MYMGMGYGSMRDGGMMYVGMGYGVWKYERWRYVGINKEVRALDTRVHENNICRLEFGGGVPKREIL